MDRYFRYGKQFRALGRWDTNYLQSVELRRVSGNSMKKIMCLTTLLVLFGALVLFTPVIAGERIQAAKGQVVKSSVSQQQLPSFRTAIIQAIKFQFGRWFGISTVTPVIDKGPNVPQKSDHDTTQRRWWIVITKDHGGDEVDI